MVVQFSGNQTRKYDCRGRVVESKLHVSGWYRLLKGESGH